jgi:hypothetical protein
LLPKAATTKGKIESITNGNKIESIKQQSEKKSTSETLSLVVPAYYYQLHMRQAKQIAYLKLAMVKMRILNHRPRLCPYKRA